MKTTKEHINRKIYYEIEEYLRINYDKPPAFDTDKNQNQSKLLIKKIKEFISPLSEEYNQESEELERILLQDTEIFSDILSKYIDEKNYSDVEVYKKANIDRKLFSKIRSNPNYHPKKATVFAFVIALELSMKEAIDMLKSAGYAFSNCSKTDLIIKYFLEKNEHDIFKINEALVYFKQPIL